MRPIAPPTPATLPRRRFVRRGPRPGAATIAALACLAGVLVAGPQPAITLAGANADVTVPNVVGASQPHGFARIAGAGLVPVFGGNILSPSIPAGSIAATSPVGGTVVPTQSQVRVFVSSGIDLTAGSSRAAWRSGAGALPFPGSDGDTRGFALVRNGLYHLPDGTPCTLEDGGTPTYLETSPQAVPDGWIDGTYPLIAPVNSSDHFRATVGFIGCGDQDGDATFTVSAIMRDGRVLEVATVSDVAGDGIMPRIDVGMAPYSGAFQLRLRVTSNGNPGQPWASWVAPRLER